MAEQVSVVPEDELPGVQVTGPNVPGNPAFVLRASVPPMAIPPPVDIVVASDVVDVHNVIVWALTGFPQTTLVEVVRAVTVKATDNAQHAGQMLSPG